MLMRRKDHRGSRTCQEGRDEEIKITSPHVCLWHGVQSVPTPTSHSCCILRMEPGALTLIAELIAK